MEPHCEEIVFLIEELDEGRFAAHSVGACIHTVFDSLEELHEEIRDALCCHFDDGCRPHGVRLKFVRTVREETLTL